MPNRNYTNSVNPIYRSSGSSAVIRAEFGSIDAGFTGVEAELDSLDLLKSPKASPTFTGTVVLPSTTSIGNVSATEIAFLDGVTSAIQTQMDSKAGLNSPALSGTPTAPTPAFGMSNTQIATMEALAAQAFNSVALPGMTSSAGMVLGTNGTTAAWKPIINIPLYQSQGGL